jgi:hypothetical protein
MTALAEQLLLLPHDQIDYPSLATDVIRHLASQRDEPFIATSALGELASRSGTVFVEVAEAILRSPWDRYLTSFALRTLYARDPESAARFMDEFVRSTDPLILEALVENVGSDASRFSSRFVCTLVSQIRALTEPRFMDADMVQTFLSEHA